MLSDLQKRCADLSYRHGLTHVSSVLNCVDLIDKIYGRMGTNDIFILGAGHASLAHFVVLEALGKCDAEDMIKRHGTHSSRDPEHGIFCSNGSLGIAETVALGAAIGNPHRDVWLVTSDGSTMEGAVYEAMRVARLCCPNLKVCVVFNGYGAYGPIRRVDLPWFPDGVEIQGVFAKKYPEWLRGLAGHYVKMSRRQYDDLMQ